MLLSQCPIQSLKSLRTTVYVYKVIPLHQHNNYDLMNSSSQDSFSVHGPIMKLYNKQL